MLSQKKKLSMLLRKWNMVVDRRLPVVYGYRSVFSQINTDSNLRVYQ